MTYIPASDRYTQMTYRRCGTSGLKLPAVSLGLWQNFGDRDVRTNYRAILWKAFDRGITHFDLANNYGPPYGSAEENFGRILSEEFSAYRDELVISTKAGYDMWPGPYGDGGSRKYLLTSLEQSLRRMRIDHVDIFYSHRPDPETPLEETMGALAHAVHQGKALYCGLSNYPAELTQRAVTLLKEMGAPCLIHQPKYSMFVRWVETGLLDVLEANGIGCIAFSPLAQGLLTDKYITGIPAHSRATHENATLRQQDITDSRRTVLVKLNEIAHRRNQTLAQMALAWVLKDRRVTSVLIGASSTAQLEENLASLGHTEFSPDELTAIETALTEQ
ncbi:MAG TPA: L-glyceraldehyde 3-phosphate reductase [Bacteroidota bacterium]|nr:L-glyceraldehyde 3-phosphate reductase [Bacteroidota bacterium]